MFAVSTNQKIKMFSSTGVLTGEIREHRIDSFLFTPNENFVVSWSNDTIKIWNVGTCKCVKEIKNDDVTYSLDINSEGTKVATGENGKCKVWDINTGEILNIFHLANRFYRVNFVSFSPDGNKILLPSTIDKNEVSIYDLNTNRFIHSFNDDYSRVHSASFSPNGSSIAICFENSCKVFNSVTYKEIFNLSKYDTIPFYSTFNKDGTILCVLFNNNNIVLYNTTTGQIFNEINTRHHVKYMTFDSNNNILVSQYDSTVTLYNFYTSEELFILNDDLMSCNKICVQGLI